MADEAIAPKDGSSPEEVAAAAAKAGEAETLETLTPAADDKGETVPLAKFMDEKRKGKEASERATALEGELAKLKGNLPEMSPIAVNDEVKKLAEKYNTPPEFIAELMTIASTSLAPKIREEMEKEFNPKLSKLENDRNADAREKKFLELLGKALKDAPEYEGVVNEETIRMLAFNPANAKKTLPQILEEAYGNAIQGRPTIERGGSGGSRGGDGEVNLLNPTDADMEKIKADPALHKEWVAQTEAELRKHL